MTVTVTNEANEIDADKAIAMGIFPCEVFCDGVKVEDVEMMNPTDGYLRYQQRDCNGEFIIDKNKCVLTNWMHGVITYKKLE